MKTFFYLLCSLVFLMQFRMWILFIYSYFYKYWLITFGKIPANEFSDFEKKIIKEHKEVMQEHLDDLSNITDPNVAIKAINQVSDIPKTYKFYVGIIELVCLFIGLFTDKAFLFATYLLIHVFSIFIGTKSPSKIQALLFLTLEIFVLGVILWSYFYPLIKNL